jgi:hypothetical protein
MAALLDKVGSPDELLNNRQSSLESTITMKATKILLWKNIAPRHWQE